MEPLRTSIDDWAVNSKCDDQLINGIIKEEIIEDTDHYNDSQLLQKRSKMAPFPLYVICDDHKFNENIKQETIDDPVINGIIKEEIIEDTDHNNDRQLFQIGSKTEENFNTIDYEIKTEKDFINSNEFNGTVLNKRKYSEFITSMDLDLASNCLRKNTLTDNSYKMTTAPIHASAHNKSSDLNVLRRTHTGKRRFICDTCNAEFTRSSSLTKHKMTHTGERPYKCVICDQAFSRLFNLTMHTRTHTREKPYKCDICDAEFSRLSHLKNHKMTHTGERPYKCDTCDRAFSQSSSLTVHTRIHTRERPYKCDTCDSEFSSSSDLTRHTRTHTGERPYKCDICVIRFSAASNLTLHKRRLHNEKMAY